MSLQCFASTMRVHRLEAPAHDGLLQVVILDRVGRIGGRFLDGQGGCAGCGDAECGGVSAAVERKKVRRFMVREYPDEQSSPLFIAVLSRRPSPLEQARSDSRGALRLGAPSILAAALNVSRPAIRRQDGRRSQECQTWRSFVTGQCRLASACSMVDRSHELASYLQLMVAARFP